MKFVIGTSAVLLALAQPGAFAAQGLHEKAASARDANFVCGGIGEGDQQAMKAQAPQHDLMLTFAESTGAYLADVAVQIRNSTGAVVLDTTCPGPIMLVDLPRSGRWHITAQINGERRDKTVATSPGHRAQATFTWPAATS